MNTIVKQRLVGALVLIALGVLLWPMIFVEPRVPALDRTTQVPAMPSLPQRQVEEPRPLQGLPEPVVEEAAEMHAELPEALASAAEPGSSAAPQEQPVAKPERPKPALDEQGIPIAWVVQVASMSQRDKAEALQTQLIAMDYKANIKTIRRGEQRLYRVYIGPSFSKPQTEKIKQNVDRAFAVSSIVSRYVP